MTARVAVAVVAREQASSTTGGHCETTDTTLEMDRGGRQIVRQKDQRTQRKGDRRTNRQRERLEDTQKGREEDRQTDRQGDRPTNTRTETDRGQESTDRKTGTNRSDRPISLLLLTAVC